MIILSIFSLFIVYFSYISHRSFAHPSCLFNTIWSFIFILLSINVYNITVENRTYIILLIMIGCFTIGSTIISSMHHKKEIYNNYKNVQPSLATVLLRKNIFISLCVVSVVIMLMDEINNIVQFFRGATFIDIIVDSGGIQTVEMSGFKAILYVFIIYPVSYAASPICASEIMAGNCNKKMYLLLNASIVFLNVMHHGGRLILLFFLLSYASAMIMYGKKIYFSSITKRCFKLLFLTSFILIYFISVSRGIDNVWGSFYIYFVCEIPVMEGLLNSSLYSVRTFGFLSLNGLFYPINIVISLFGFSLPQAFNDTQNLRQFIESNWIYLEGYGHNVNAFIPAGAYMYIDGGAFGEIIGMVIYGMLCTHFYFKAKDTPNQKNISLYSMLFISMVLSFIRFYGASYQFVIATILIILLYKNDTAEVDYKYECARSSS